MVVLVFARVMKAATDAVGRLIGGFVDDDAALERSRHGLELFLGDVGVKPRQPPCWL